VKGEKRTNENLSLLVCEVIRGDGLRESAGYAGGIVTDGPFEERNRPQAFFPVTGEKTLSNLKKHMETSRLKVVCGQLVTF